MQVFYEEDGGFKVGTVLADNTTSLQVEAASGRRTKVKAANVLLRFDDVPVADFGARAKAVADAIDVDFLWQCCGPDEFAFDELGREYFGHAPGTAESAGLLMRLHDAPMYFYKRGKGRYRAAPEDALKAALAGLERKRLEAERQAQYVAELRAGRLPDALRPLVDRLLYKPDRASIEARCAFAEAAEELGVTPAGLLAHCGALPASHDFHFNRFLFEHFPGEPVFPELPALVLPDDLPLAAVDAFSIDDAQTTEIDDALSVTPLEGGHVRIGVHIAAPALAITPDTPWDAIARARLSTVYMPGRKITMLPPAAVERFTLAEGRECPAVSFYADVAPDGTVTASESRVERVRIAANLRHDTLEPVFNPDTLAAGLIDFPYGAELERLWRFATHRQALRGGADQQFEGKVDYSFHVEDDRVRITERRRGSPIDTVVAELMILVNAEWGRLLAERGVTGIYRAQAQGKVRMTTVPAPHEGLGVAQYAWSSSPIRRYVDLVNQRQLVAALAGERPPYARNDASLLAAMREFELAYDAYAEFQRTMERYWCLRWLEQEGVATSGATVIRESLVRFDRIPLVARVPSLPELPPQARVEVAVTGIDLYDVEVRCEFRARLDAAG